MVISSVPLVALVPVQAPDAEQLVVLEEDQFRLITDPSRTDDEDDDNEAVGLGGGLLLPPPPPPPQEERKRKRTESKCSLLLPNLNSLLFIVFLHYYLNIICVKLKLFFLD